MSQLVADIHADLARFRTGADPTLDVENILDLIDLYERAVADRVKLRTALLHVMDAAGGIDYQSDCPDCIAACDLAFGKSKVG